MPGAPEIAFTYDHRVGDDGSITFRCLGDVAAWPWLELPPCHPIVVQTISYWISVECSAARGSLDQSKWSAMTWMDWECGDPDAGHAASGTMEGTGSGDKLGFLITLHDAKNRLVCRIHGRGVVFRTRDFEGWRKQAKEKLAVDAGLQDFVFAEVAAVGAPPGEHALIAPLSDDPPIHADALVTAANGLPPASRYMSGSGDHVNTTHLGEACRQFAALLLHDPAIRFSGGEMHFNRYIELNVPFRLQCVSQSDERLDLTISQAGRECMRAALRIA
ncbi:hypothetical protein [Altererythrobacter sp.]|uniref:hypothetical protein n=1 Tax=Altererythrobacter sp. TaxID=1872480 RepID=UPI003CFC9CBE